MTSSERSRRIPIDEAEFEAWLAETLNLPAEAPRPLRDPQAEGLQQLVQHMREMLVPIEPSPNFVHDLGQTLAQMAGQRLTFRQRYGRIIFFGLAAAGSVVSVVSVGAYWYYRREARHLRTLLF
jgi:hypothetical protein